ncbi:MAG: hypothetical protein N4A46_06655, partial [Schleiferiaceae bacterium]|nr:hypothetical protein [Schleiferiaceae bacterium]
MKKVLFILLLLSSFIKVEATHLLGGELYFDKIDNQGRYLLTTILYRENTGLGVGLQLPVKTNATVSGTLMLPLVDSLPVATISLGCIGFGADAYVFQDTIQVLMPIPVSGYYFSHSTCCRPISLDNINHSGGSNSFAINARMYPGVERSPRFQNFPVLSGIAGTSTFLNHSAFDPDIGDSIYIDLAAPNTNVQNGAFTSVSYKSNYSASFPFGTNVPTTIDNKTGLITVTNAPVGWYVVGVRVRSYTNGALTAETLRDVPIVFDNAVSPPNFTLSNIYGQASYAQNGANYDFEMNETDTLGFDLIASSTLLINNLPVDVGIEGFGDLLDTNFSGAGNCVGNSCMNFSSASGSFINPLLTSTNIFFRPDTGFVPSGLSHVYKYLSFDGFLLDTCNIPRRTSIGVRIKVNANGPIHSKAYYNSCKGIGVQANIQGDTTNLLWTPSHGVSNPNSATAWLDPDSSIVYSVKDLNTGFVIMVSVSVDSIGQSFVILGNNGLELYVPQVVQIQEVSWYYNGALLPIGSDTTLPMVTGYYWAKVSHGVCSIWSDTVYVKITGKTSNTDYNGEG